MNVDPPLSPSRDQKSVQQMFGRIAPRYDLANHLLSGGADFFWRARAAQIVKKWQPATVLDLAAGSGDLTLAISRQLSSARIVAADFSAEMLERARKKGVRETVVADALALPFEDASLDCVTVAFGLRNMADWRAALCEMHRVLKVGGHLLVLDFSLPNEWLRPAYRFYLHCILPRLAALITGEKAAYDYLGGTIEEFPSGRAMTTLITSAGFENAKFQPLTAGIATIYTAAKS